MCYSSRSYGGIQGCVGPHGPAYGTYCSVRDVSTEPCPTRTSWLCQQCSRIGTKPIIMSVLEQKFPQWFCTLQFFFLSAITLCFAKHFAVLRQACMLAYTLGHCTLEIIR